MPPKQKSKNIPLKERYNSKDVLSILDASDDEFFEEFDDEMESIASSDDNGEPSVSASVSTMYITQRCYINSNVYILGETDISPWTSPRTFLHR